MHSPCADDKLSDDAVHVIEHMFYKKRERTVDRQPADGAYLYRFCIAGDLRKIRAFAIIERDKGVR